MKKTINQIRVELNEIATKHGQLNSFAWKDFLRAYTEQELNYPLMCAYYPSGSLSLNQTEISLTIIIADKIYKDWNKNLNEVESDTLQICRDVFNIINQSDRWQRIGRVSSCTVNKFIERGGDEVAGHTMTMNFLIRDNSGVCDIPIFDYDFNQEITLGCLPVNVFNSDSSYTQEVASGDDLELPDVTYAVKNSLGTTLAGATVPSVTNIDTTLSDVDNIDSDGSTVPTPAGVAFTCTPVAPCNDATAVLKDTALTVISTTSIASGASADITAPDATYTVQYEDATPIASGSIVSGGSVLVEVPVCPAGGSVGATLMRTGQTTSYRTGDDPTRGRATDFFTLAENNPFGNTNRFTDELGGANYANNIIIDWSTYDGSTVLGYYRTLSSISDWDGAVDWCIAQSIGTFTSGWELINIIELTNISNYSASHVLNYSPFNIDPSTDPVFISNTLAYNSGYAKRITQYGDIGYIYKGDTGTCKAMAVRNFTVTGTTLT